MCNPTEEDRMPFVERPEAHKIYSSFINPELCDEAIDYVNSFEKKMKKTPYNCKVFTSDHITYNILNDTKLQKLHLHILSHMQNYMTLSESYYDGFIEKSWFNVYYEDFYQEFHVHMDPLYRAFCGILYLTDSPESATEFYLHDRISIEPEKGKIVIFPDYVEHRAAPNNSSEKRITMAFNYRKCNIWRGVQNNG